jgi:hypothetical protein
MNWLGTLVKQVDYLRGRYQAFPVHAEEERDGCMRVLKAVRQEELNRVSGKSVMESAAFVDAEVQDELYGCRDTGNGDIVGCIRCTGAAQLAGIEGSRREYLLDAFPPAILERTAVLTRLAFLPAYRKSAASLVLFQGMYRDHLQRGTLLTLLSCEPGLYPGYLRLGARPLGSVHAGSSGGFRIPMVFVNHDQAQLDAVRSPVASTLSRWDGVRPQDGIAWYRDFVARHGPIETGVAFYSDDDEEPVHGALTRGLSADGRDALLRNAIEVDCRPGDVIIAADDGGRSMGLVLEGVVQVEKGDRVLGVLGEGELFGDMAFVLETRRTARVVAGGDDTRVLLFSQSGPKRVKDPADQAVLWRNLARVIAQRLLQRERG